MVLFLGGVGTYCLNFNLDLLAPALISTVNQAFAKVSFVGRITLFIIFQFLLADFKLLKSYENNGHKNNVKRSESFVSQ